MKILVLNPPNKYGEPISRDLIYGCWCHGKRVADIQLPPLNLMYIATVLKEDHNVTLLDALAEKKSIETIGDNANNYDLLIIASSNTTFLDDIYIAKKFKENNKNLKVIFCGPHTTVYPKECLKKAPVIDIGIFGEVEETIKELVNKLQTSTLDNVKGISYRENNHIKVNNPRRFIKDLDTLPIPDRTLINSSIYYSPLAEKTPFTTALTSRGCIGRCIFCTSPSFYGKTYRFRSAENVLNELEYLQSLGFKEILFRDESFTINRKRLIDICNGIKKRNININWCGNSRVGVLNKELAQLMKNSGCNGIWLGVESGNQQILNNIKKDITLEQTEQTFKVLKKAKLKTHAHFMFGNPGETKETIRTTIKFIKKIKPDTIDIGILTPFPGTELFDIIKKKCPEISDGTQHNISKVHSKAFFNKYLCELSAEDLEKSIYDAYKAFYLRPNYILNQLTKIKSKTQLVNAIKGGTNVIKFALQ